MQVNLMQTSGAFISFMFHVQYIKGTEEKPTFSSFNVVIIFAIVHKRDNGQTTAEPCTRWCMAAHKVPCSFQKPKGPFASVSCYIQICMEMPVSTDVSLYPIGSRREVTGPPEDREILWGSKRCFDNGRC